MNQLQKVFAVITDSQLADMIEDYQTLENTGILPSGPVRDLTRVVVNEIGLSYHDATNCVKAVVINKAAFKWLESFKSKSI